MNWDHGQYAGFDPNSTDATAPFGTSPGPHRLPKSIDADSYDGPAFNCPMPMPAIVDYAHAYGLLSPLDPGGFSFPGFPVTPISPYSPEVGYLQQHATEMQPSMFDSTDMVAPGLMLRETAYMHGVTWLDAAPSSVTGVDGDTQQPQNSSQYLPLSPNSILSPLPYVPVPGLEPSPAAAGQHPVLAASSVAPWTPQELGKNCSSPAMASSTMPLHSPDPAHSSHGGHDGVGDQASHAARVGHQPAAATATRRRKSSHKSRGVARKGKLQRKSPVSTTDNTANPKTRTGSLSTVSTVSDPTPPAARSTSYFAPVNPQVLPGSRKRRVVCDDGDRGNSQNSIKIERQASKSDEQDMDQEATPSNNKLSDLPSGSDSKMDEDTDPPKDNRQLCARERQNRIGKKYRKKLNDQFDNLQAILDRDGHVVESNASRAANKLQLLAETSQRVTTLLQTAAQLRAKTEAVLKKGEQESGH